MERKICWCGLVVVGLMMIGCADREPTVSVGAVEFSAPAWSGEANLFATADGRVVLTWLEPAGEDAHVFKFAVRTADGWSEPGTIHESDHFFVNWADFPSLVQLNGGEWVAQWLEKVPGGTYAYHVKLAISADGGATWSEPIVPHRDDSPTEHGFVSMVPTSDGGASLVWLDGRNMAGEDEGAGHDELDRGDMSLRATSVSATGELGEDVLLDSRTCECCQTALVQAASGLVAAYRDRSGEEIRDISVARLSGGGWTEPRLVRDDNFYYPGCPVNGPQLSASGDDVAVAWYTAPEQQARVFVAFSSDGGATFGSPIQVDGGDPLGRVDIEYLADGLAIVSWLERSAAATDVRVRLVRPDGWMGESIVVSETSESRSSGFPRIARVGDEVVVAWTLIGEAGGVRAATIQLND